jgi:uncharacterized protein YgbK (DUF1537 family)
MRPETNPVCLLIADDLTGACDTGVQFARRGWSCEVQFELSTNTSSQVNVVAYNTNSRNDDLSDSRRKIKAIAESHSGRKTGALFKKIDSTMRGNVGEEIAAALEYFHCECAIIAPAYPEMHRTVQDGVLESTDCSGAERIDIPQLLAQQGIASEQIVSIKPGVQNPATLAFTLNTDIANGARLVVVDSISQDDLRAVVTTGTKLGRRILWVGSAGLAIALADHLGQTEAAQATLQAQDASVVFCIGSTHPVTVRQKAMLMTAADVVEIEAESKNIKAARQAVREKRHLVVIVERGKATEFSVREVFCCLEGLPLAAIVFTGGDTGMLVCKVLGVQTIQLRHEIVPGLPWGTLCGGAFPGLSIASKSGGFGNDDALLRSAEFFASPRKELR